MPKENQMLVINKDAREMLRRQAERAELSVSNYIERIILEKEWEYKRELQTKNMSDMR